MKKNQTIVFAILVVSVLLVASFTLLTNEGTSDTEEENSDITSMTFYIIDGGKSTVSVEQNSVLWGDWGTIALEGSIISGLTGFSNNQTLLAVPGPALSFRVGETINMTIINLGSSTHGWEIVSGGTFSEEDNIFDSTNAEIVFGAGIESIDPGQSTSVVFTVTEYGNYYYISPLQQDAQKGMWGEISVSSE